MNNLYGLIISILYIGLVILLSNLFTKASKEASRKFIHIMLSNWWIIAMIFFNNVWFASILPAIFIIINYLSYKYDLIKEMERDDNDSTEKTLGTVYYTISLLILSITTFGIINKPLVGLIGVLIMGYGDGFAAIAGQSIKSKSFKIFGSTKSIAGSATMFIISLIIVSGAFAYLGINLWLIKSILIAFIVTVFEAVSPKGTDNLTIPLLSSLLVYCMI